MKQKKVWRYYCEFCRKAGCAKGTIAKHERHCCANPNRVCRMCVLVTGEEGLQRPIAELTTALYDVGLERVKELAHNCPACILAAIIQLRKRDNASPHDEEYWFEFDFKTAVREMWEQLNLEADERERREWLHAG